MASLLDISFYEGDDFYSEANVNKMAEGIPLTDEDRQGWLADLADLIRGELNKGHSGVLACSALKEKYREQLRIDPEKVKFIYLKGSYDLIISRMKTRKNHYMTPEIQKSQFQALEKPSDSFKVDIQHPPEKVVDDILSYLYNDKIVSLEE